MVLSFNKNLDDLVRGDVDKVSCCVNLGRLKVLHETNVLVGAIVSILKNSGQVEYGSWRILPDEIRSVKDNNLSCCACTV